MNLSGVNTSYFNDLSDFAGKRYINALKEQEIIEGYVDNSFKPEQTITRAEAISILIKAVGVKNQEEIIRLSEYQPYNDIENHWAENEIKIANYINLTTDNSFFNPDQKATRAEAARYLYYFQAVRGDSGYITDIYPHSKKMSVNLDSGQRKIFDFDDDTVIGRNNRIVDMDEILNTDKVFIIANENDYAKYIKAYGIITQSDLATEVSNISQGLLEPQEVKELSRGNFQFLQPKLIESVKIELSNQGLNQEEINAIMNTEWDNLERLSKTRLSEAIAIRTGLPLDITNSLLEGDWQNIRSYAQVALIQRIVQEVLSNDLLS